MWLSLLSLPLHGMAGTMMLICMSDRHDTATSSVQPERQDSATAMPGDSTLSAAGTIDDGDAPDGGLGTPSTIKCGAGSVCFASVALPASASEVPVAGPAGAPSFFVSETRVSFFTGGPDRPPRPVFA